MQLTRRGALAGAAALTATPIVRARAQAKPTIKLGVLTDLSGTYRDTTGPNSVTCTRQAVI
jgi:branched-chain amino acid transport system substrate-binding protein